MIEFIFIDPGFDPAFLADHHLHHGKPDPDRPALVDQPANDEAIGRRLNHGRVQIRLHARQLGLCRIDFRCQYPEALLADRNTRDIEFCISHGGFSGVGVTLRANQLFLGELLSQICFA